jgi:hypothetical protein
MANGEYFQSDVVFTGTVVSAQYDSNVGGYYTLRVERVFRGPIRDKFSVYTDSGDTRLPLEKGRTYLLFAYRRNGRLEIDSCGNSDLLSKGAEAVHTIENIPRARRYGVIEG